MRTFGLNRGFRSLHLDIFLYIIQVRSDLLPEGGTNLGIKTMHTVQARVSDIMDSMGQASALAQDLRQPITSGAKLRMQDEHTVYLLVDRSSNGGFGSVVGMIKVGKKVSVLKECQSLKGIIIYLYL